MLRVLAKTRDGRERSGSYNPSAAIGRGGAGAVFRDESTPGRVFKIYHNIIDPETLQPPQAGLDQQRRRELERKATGMLATAPPLPQDGRRTSRPSIAWPLECVYTQDGRFIGFSMDEVADALPLDFVLTEALRSQRDLPPGYDYALRIAESLASAVERLHRGGHAVVDLTPKHVRVYRDEPEVALIGTDKYRIYAGHTVYPARFLTESIAAPELQKSAGARPDLAGEHQDRFALAFLIFQLLNEGATPYDAVGRGDFDPPTDLSRRILDRLYPFGLKAHPQVAPPRTSLHEHWPPHLREMFDAAFSASDPSPSARPTPVRWAETLRILREQARTCAAQPRLHGKARLEPREGPCMLCMRDQRLGRAPAQPSASTPKAAAIGAMRAARAALNDARLPYLNVARLRVFAAALVFAVVAGVLFFRLGQETPAAEAAGELIVAASAPQSPSPASSVPQTSPASSPQLSDLLAPPLEADPLAVEPSPARPNDAAAKIHNVRPSSMEQPRLSGYMRYAPRAASYTLAFTVDGAGKARDIVIERGAPAGYGFEAEARRLAKGALFRNTPAGAQAPYRARMRLDFPFDASPANAYAARRAGGASAPAPAAPEAVKLDRSALVRVGFILGADGRARSVSITGRDANAEADSALFETEARKFIAASSFETPPDIPRQGLRSSYVVEFTPASVQTAPQAAQTLGPRAWRWARRPTGAELDREFPDRAISARRSGDVTLACLVQPQGTLNCAVVSESPEGYRFGAAALRVVREARVAETFTNGQTAVGQQITVPIRFEYRESPAPRSASNQR